MEENSENGNRKVTGDALNPRYLRALSGVSRDRKALSLCVTGVLEGITWVTVVKGFRHWFVKFARHPYGILIGVRRQ